MRAGLAGDRGVVESRLKKALKMLFFFFFSYRKEIHLADSVVFS